MFFKPKWLKLLPEFMRPEEKKIRELENLRVEFGIPHEALALSIAGSPWTTLSVQKLKLFWFRSQNPSASENEILRMVLISTLEDIEVQGFSVIEDQEIEKAMEDIKSINDLCDYINKLFDIIEPPFPDPFGIGNRIDKILG